jgi:flagellar protein FliJ
MGQHQTLLRLRKLELETCQLALANLVRQEASIKEKLIALKESIFTEHLALQNNPVFQKEWPNFVKASQQKEEIYLQELDIIQSHILKAQEDLRAAFKGVKTLEIVIERHKTEAQKAEDKRQQMLMDEIGLRKIKP